MEREKGVRFGSTARAMVSASTGAMKSVLAKLTALSADEDDMLLKGVKKKKITTMRDELASMNGLLEKMADKEDLDPLVKGWMKQVREMTFDIEDSIDDLSKNLPSSSRDADCGLKLLFPGKSRNRFAIIIEELNARVQEAAARRSRYNLDAVENPASKLGPSPMPRDIVPIDPRLQLPPVTCPVGTDGRRHELIQLLDLSAQEMKAVSVVGCGGIGKTTLAMEVYQSIKQKFDFHAFVSMPQRYDPSMVFRSILAEEQDPSAGLDDLIEKLTAFLASKSYLIIVDNVRDALAWKIIKVALPPNNLGSRIIVTTRVLDLAKSCCYDEASVYKMKPLTDDWSRELFFRRISSPEDDSIHESKLCEEILKKCGGLPLAISTIASLLATKSASATAEWMSTLDSTGFDDLEGLMRMLNYCYVDLPIHLRTCLLYMSIFPENRDIDKTLLIRRWIAKGFVEAHSRMSLEEAGESYFNELINRGLIRPVSIRYNGRIEVCKVNGERAFLS